MDPKQYTHGPPIKVAAIKPGDWVWFGFRVRTVIEKCETEGNWFRLKFDDGGETDLTGNDVLERAVLIGDVDAPRTVNVTELWKDNLKLESQLMDLAAQVARLEAELLQTTANHELVISQLEEIVREN